MTLELCLFLEFQKQSYSSNSGKDVSASNTLIHLLVRYIYCQWYSILIHCKQHYMKHYRGLSTVSTFLWLIDTHLFMFLTCQICLHIGLYPRSHTFLTNIRFIAPSSCHSGLLQETTNSQSNDALWRNWHTALLLGQSYLIQSIAHVNLRWKYLYFIEIKSQDIKVHGAQLITLF